MLKRKYSSLGQVIAVVAVVFLGVTAVAQTSEEQQVLQFARQARSAGDPATALLYLNMLVKQSPQFGLFYYERAITLHVGGDVAGARRDIDHVIELNPQWLNSYALRAKWRMEELDYAGAIEDANVTKNSSSEMVELRGRARLALGLHAAALEDFLYLRSGPFGHHNNLRYPAALCLLGLGRTQAAVDLLVTDFADGGSIDALYCSILGRCILGQTELAEKELAQWMAAAEQPEPTGDYERSRWQALRESVDDAAYLVGVMRFSQGDFTGTASALEKLDANDYARLLRHVALLRSQQPDDDLKTSGGLRQDWAKTLAGLFLGEVTEEQLLNIASESADAAERRRRECEAAFYAGQKRLAGKDKVAARLWFEKAVATGVSDLSEYALAKIALQSH